VAETLFFNECVSVCLSVGRGLINQPCLGVKC